MNFRTSKETRKADDDREFIAKVQAASLEALLVMDHNHRQAAKWKQVAIQRQIAKRVQ